MRTRLIPAAWCLIALPAVVSAETCLVIANLEGQAAYSINDYAFDEDRFSDRFTFCFEGDYGSFDNNDGVFTKFGSNTWIWFNSIENRTEVAEVWTFDFANRKALFARTRVAGAALPATVGAFVGDIEFAL